MKNTMTLSSFFSSHIEKLLFFFSLCISVAAISYYMFHGNQNLANYDAVARLDIARKVINSLTPGAGQLGGVWLPLPQVLFIPFIWNDYLWHSGLAGAIISGIAFIVGSVFLYKTALLITKKMSVALLVWFMFVTNINILFLQTMAMSEIFFVSNLIMVIYFLTKWIQNHAMLDFLAAAFFVILISLTRYEGYFVLIGASLTVFMECVRAYRRENWQKIEGLMLFFITVAGFGIAAWCVYCFLYYGDFLYWLHLYSEGKQQVSTATQSVKGNNARLFTVKQNSLADALRIYSTSIMWMNGKILVFLSLLGAATGFTNFFRKSGKKELALRYLPVFVIGIVLFAFLVYGYQRGFIPEIKLPPKFIPVDQRKSFTIYSDSNIRYGIIVAPLLLLFAGIAAAKNKFFYTLVALSFFAQFAYNLYKPGDLQYSLPDAWPYSTVAGVNWFKNHYDGGLILISANAHEDFVFQTGLPYDNFIYEGSREYWQLSLDNPERFATWVIVDDAVVGDSLHYFLTPKAKAILAKDYDLRYDDRRMKFYRLRTIAR